MSLDCSYSKADVVFLLDASTSEGEENFRKQLDFVGNFTNRYDIGTERLMCFILIDVSRKITSLY